MSKKKNNKNNSCTFIFRAGGTRPKVKTLIKVNFFVSIWI
jgi:hypothetical protein